MRVRGLAIFWTRPGWRMQFHADMTAQPAAQAVAAFKALFPGDVVCSVRDTSGRFLAFKA